MQTGRKIMNLRLDLDITQRDLAEACGITPGALSKIETGSNQPSAAVLRRLARALGVSADYLLDDAAPYPPLAPSITKTGKPGEGRKRVTTRITQEELWLIEDLRRLGDYWREAAFAIPGARVETIRLVRYLLQRDQLTGAREAEDAARRAARKTKGNGKKRKTAGKRKKRAKKR